MSIRRFRSVAALAAIASLLFAQLAVSAYACPRVQAAKPATMHAGGGDAGCDEMDTANPALCHGHCQYGNQSVDKWAGSWVSPDPAVLSSVVYEDAVPDAAARGVVPRVWLARTTAPPIAIRNCCLRF